MNTMYAMTQSEFGGPEVLHRIEVDLPQPASGEVRVRVLAAGVNPVDTAARAGYFPLFPEPAKTLGWDVAGVVDAVGDGVERFEVGDQVFGMPRFPQETGAYAQYVTAPAEELAVTPQTLSAAEAGALPLAGLTAWQSLVHNAGIRSGQRVLIHAAAGGVGHLAVQIAKAKGATVIVTARSGNHEFLRSLGAAELIDYTTTDFAVVIAPVDVVLDLVGGEYGFRSLEVLKPEGVLVTTVAHKPGVSEAEVTGRGLRYAATFVQPSSMDLESLAQLSEAGKLRVHVSQELPLTDAGKAHELAETTSAKGKLVLIP